jgi:periplasmic protein TonB
MKKLSSIFFAVFTISAYGQIESSGDSTSTCILITEQMPSYPGGYERMKIFIQKNLKYPQTSGCVEGAVYVQFIVNKDGSLSEFKVVKGLGEPFDSNALDVVRKMPNWLPAKGEDNLPVQTRMVIPLKFSL